MSPQYYCDTTNSPPLLPLYSQQCFHSKHLQIVCFYIPDTVPHDTPKPIITTLPIVAPFEECFSHHTAIEMTQIRYSLKRQKLHPYQNFPFITMLYLLYLGISATEICHWPLLFNSFIILLNQHVFSAKFTDICMHPRLWITPRQD